MDDTHAVRGSEGVAELLEDEEQRRRRHGAVLFDVRREIGSAEQLHGQPRSLARRVDARAHDVNHVIAFDARADARLPLEAPPQSLIGDQLRMHQLERASRAGADLIDDVDGPHPAFAQRTYDAEVRREDAPWIEAND